jgi:AcrR family transcriptional regulator
MKKSAITRQRILDAARTLFSLHGLESTTIDDVITSAGVTKGAFYHYFSSKENLCEVIIEDAHGQYQQLVESLPSELSSLDQLRAMLENLARLNASGEWVNCRLMLKLLAEPHSDSAEISHKLIAFWQWYKGFYEDLITKCRLQGQLPAHLDPQRQTHFLLAMLAGFCQLNQFDPSTPPLSEMIDQIIKAL